MKEINFKKECHGNVNQVIERLTNALKREGLGVLTRIDQDAYQINPEVATLLPCNAVVREISQNKISVEFASPSFMMDMIHDENLVIMAKETDSKLHRVLECL